MVLIARFSCSRPHLCGRSVHWGFLPLSPTTTGHATNHGRVSQQFGHVVRVQVGERRTAALPERFAIGLILSAVSRRGKEWFEFFDLSVDFKITPQSLIAARAIAALPC